jgi:hypothetical protein
MQSKYNFYYCFQFRIDKKLKKIDRIINKKIPSSSIEDCYYSEETDSDNYVISFSKKILNQFINFRILILHFISNYEFYVFYSVIDIS